MATKDWRNMFLRILSLVLAVLLWIYATNERNPAQSQILSVPVTQKGLPDRMVVSGIPQNVSIRVQGTRGEVTALSPYDFKAEVDLSRIGEGEQSLPVKITAPPGVKVIQVTPARVDIVADSIVEQQVEVKAALKGSPAQGYTAQDPVVQPGTVTVRGPRSKVGAIGQISVPVDVEAATAQVEKSVPVTVAQAGVSVSPQLVTVTVPIIPMPSKMVPVQATVTGVPADGYEVGEVSVRPGEVRVTAPQAVLAGITGLGTEPVNVAGADHDITVKATLISPSPLAQVKPPVVDVVVTIRKAAAAAPAPQGNESAQPPG
ncbi:MAG: YbbR-like domain-containing protein [Bacillota bacterium]